MIVRVELTAYKTVFDAAAHWGMKGAGDGVPDGGSIGDRAVRLLARHDGQCVDIQRGPQRSWGGLPGERPIRPTHSAWSRFGHAGTHSSRDGEAACHEHIDASKN